MDTIFLYSLALLIGMIIIFMFLVHLNYIAPMSDEIKFLITIGSLVVSVLLSLVLFMVV